MSVGRGTKRTLPSPRPARRAGKNYRSSEQSLLGEIVVPS